MDQAYSGKCIFLTGATGFLGKVTDAGAMLRDPSKRADYSDQ